MKIKSDDLGPLRINCVIYFFVRKCVRYIPVVFKILIIFNFFIMRTIIELHLKNAVKS